MRGVHNTAQDAEQRRRLANEIGKLKGRIQRTGTSRLHLRKKTVAIKETNTAAVIVDIATGQRVQPLTPAFLKGIAPLYDGTSATGDVCDVIGYIILINCRLRAHSSTQDHRVDGCDTWMTLPYQCCDGR